MLKKITLMGFVALIILWLSGCTLNQLGEGGIFSKKSEKPKHKGPLLIDYALASNGAKVKCSGAAHAHPPETIINGITDSSGWHSGEGWECQFSLTSYYRPGYGYNYYWWYDYWGRRYWEDDPRYIDESAWIEILLPARKKINRVVVHAYYSKKRVQHGLGEALLQSWTGNRWINIAEVREGFAYYPTRSKPEQGRYEFTFVPVETDRLRLFVLRGDKKSMRKLRTGGGRTVEEHWARIVEIEVTGTEIVNGSSTTEETPQFLSVDRFENRRIIEFVSSLTPYEAPPTKDSVHQSFRRERDEKEKDEL